MRKIIRVIVFHVAPVKPVCSFNDMLTQVNHTAAMIKAASTPLMLMLLEDKISQIAEYYQGIIQMPYHVGKLRTLVLVKRCELLTIRYPENEEA